MLTASLLTALLAGCSNTPTSDQNAKSVIDYDANTDYRDTEKSLSVTLETPPNLLMPSGDKDAFNDALSASEKSVAEQVYEYIPTYRADHLQVKSNLSERWLEIDGMSSEKVWEGLQAFFVSLGMPVKEARKDIGVIRTQFTPRKELVPLDAQGPLTRMLNSWRPELAEGLYDRLIARVESDRVENVTRVYFHHFMVADVTQAEGDADAVAVSSGWKIKPYNPVMEAEALYQAMVFFGASQAEAIKELEMTEHRMELAEGTAFDGVKVKASVDETWGYLKAMLYRAGWHIERLDNAAKALWVQVPEEARKEQSLGSKLAFWRSEDTSKYLPKVVKFSVESLEKESVETTWLRVQSGGQGQPLDAEKKQYIFQSLGIFNP